MTENNTGQSRSSQHRHTKKKSSSPSNKKKILKKVLQIKIFAVLLPPKSAHK